MTVPQCHSRQHRHHRVTAKWPSKDEKGFYRDPGFDQNIVPDSGNVNGVWLWRGSGIRQNLATDAGLGKKMKGHAFQTLVNVR